jgi:hypothetical protein
MASSPCSAAKPMSTCPSVRRSESPLSTSTVGSTSIVGVPRSFFSFEPEGLAGLKSATAAAISNTSQRPNSCSHAPASSAALSTRSTRTPRGASSPTFAAIRVTLAPRRAASAASARPIRPEERFPMKRTLSIGSRVPPAVTSTRSSLIIGVASSRSHASRISAGSASLPIPCSPWEAS